MKPENLRKKDFIWSGLDYCLKSGEGPILTLEQDKTYPHLYCIRYPDGWTSTFGNLTRAKDAAYGHAMWLLGCPRDGEGGGYSIEMADPVPTTAKPNGRLYHD